MTCSMKSGRLCRVFLKKKQQQNLLRIWITFYLVEIIICISTMNRQNIFLFFQIRQRDYYWLFSSFVQRVPKAHLV